MFSKGSACTCSLNAFPNKQHLEYHGGVRTVVPLVADVEPESKEYYINLFFKSPP